jgi:hypothetical protein
VLALTNVMNFLAYELAGLRRWRLSLPLVSTRPFQRFFFWHESFLADVAVQDSFQINC